MTLGFGLIDQVEEIKESVFTTLATRLNLQHVPSRQLIMTSNPLLFWGYKFFKQEKDTDRELIEFSMLDNKENLTEDYLADMLKRPENWKRQYVFGVWDESLLSDHSVIPIEYIQAQRCFVKQPIRTLEGVKIYKDVVRSDAGRSVRDHNYQAGFDISEGLGKDFCAMTIFDCHAGEEVAFFKTQMQPDQFAMKCMPVMKYFNNALAIPEINGVGLAFLSRLKEHYDNIYHRRDFDKTTNEEKEVLGWKTTVSTKPLLVDNFIKLLREGIIKIRSEEICAEMATFVYTDEANKKGMGAEVGFHDDALISCALACLDLQKNKIDTGVEITNFDHMMAGGRSGSW